MIRRTKHPQSMEHLSTSERTLAMFDEGHHLWEISQTIGQSIIMLSCLICQAREEQIYQLLRRESCSTLALRTGLQYEHLYRLLESSQSR